ncbi:hypothetical protein EDC04DRAFT_2891424 [Pisolithus marmoratus]|nr:hypothetical protein EDC04DRAFT_2891424 [Pisolithus marmoratus]
MKLRQQLVQPSRLYHEASRSKDTNPKVIDMQGVEDNLPGVEVEVVDASNSHDEHMNLVKAPDEDSQHTSDKIEESQALPGLSSKALEPKGDLPFATSKCTETRTGHRKPEDEVVDTQHVVDVLPMFEVGSTGQAWYSKHAKEHEAPDEDGQCASNKVRKSQDLPKSSSEVLKPAGNPIRWASGHSIEMITNVPDPPGTPMKLPTPQVKHSRLQNRPSA